MNEHTTTEYDFLYLRALEQMALYHANSKGQLDHSYWFYQELKQSLEHYKKLANINPAPHQEEPYFKW